MSPYLVGFEKPLCSRCAVGDHGHCRLVATAPLIGGGWAEVRCLCDNKVHNGGGTDG